MTIINADCLDWMRSQPDNSISCIVTDPPYGLHFMNKGWDKFKKDGDKYGRKVRGVCSNSAAHAAGGYDDRKNDEFEEFIYHFGIEALRIVRPGGHILMFGAPRRYHRQACGLEDAGWEIRDSLMWLFGSGFPKSHNHFGLEGFGTALKPAYEPIIMAMKPLDGTFKQNAEKWGQAGINIDACRVPINFENDPDLRRSQATNTEIPIVGKKHGVELGKHDRHSSKGRWPANLILDEEAGAMLDEKSGISKSKSGGFSGSNANPMSWDEDNKKRERISPNDSGGASRFFYCAKASSSERNAGLEGMPLKENDPAHFANPRLNDQRMDKEQNRNPKQNSHPTVKPLKLMEYLIKLIMPPKDGILLDPFAGSGTTILAAQNLGFNAIGIEKEKEYCDIAEARLKAGDTQIPLPI